MSNRTAAPPEPVTGPPVLQPPEQPPAEPPARRFKFPPKPGTYHELPNCDVAASGAKCVDTSFTFRFKQLWDSAERPVRGRARVGAPAYELGAEVVVAY